MSPKRSSVYLMTGPRYRQGFVLLLTLMLGVFLSALVARTYQSETQSKAHIKNLTEPFKNLSGSPGRCYVRFGFPKKHAQVVLYGNSH